MHWGQCIAINCGISKKIRTPFFQGSSSFLLSCPICCRPTVCVCISLKHLHILAQLCLSSLCSQADDRRTLVGSCAELHQQSPPNRRNNKKQALFEEGLPCIHTRSNPVSVLHFSSMLQDKQVTAPYGGVRKINNLKKFMCGTQISNRRNTNTGIIILNPSNTSLSRRGATKRQP